MSEVKETCQECKFWVSSSTDRLAGECRRYPPTAKVHYDWEHSYFEIVTTFEDFCGEFKRSDQNEQASSLKLTAEKEMRADFGNISKMTLNRWYKKGFPRPLVINGRNYWTGEQLENDIPEWFEKMHKASEQGQSE